MDMTAESLTGIISGIIGVVTAIINVSSMKTFKTKI